MMKPTLGRIVHYMEGGYVFAALIVGIVPDEPAPTKVRLVFWNEFGNQAYRDSIEFSREVAKDERHWFWPPIPKPSVEEIQKLREEMMKTVTTVKPPAAKS
jgi:hypothetical protein